MSQEIEAFFGELYSAEIKKAVLQGRANSESIRETAIRLNVTDERIRQVEAKITRKFAMSSSGRIILSKLSTLRTADDLRAYAGEYYTEILHLLRLYKSSFYYDGAQLEYLALEDTITDKEHDLSIMDLLGVDSETYEQLRQWLANCEQSGEPMSSEKIGRWLEEHRQKA